MEGARSTYRNDTRPRNSQQYHLDLLVYVFWNTLFSTEPHQVDVATARIQGPDQSGAVAGSSQLRL
jgi:hypothetical protein